jgi:hypothetical protein
MSWAALYISTEGELLYNTHVIKHKNARDAVRVLMLHIKPQKEDFHTPKEVHYVIAEKH